MNRLVGCLTMSLPMRQPLRKDAYTLQPTWPVAAAAGTEAGLALAALPAVAECHQLAPECLSQLLFTVIERSAVTLEGVLPPPALTGPGP